MKKILFYSIALLCTVNAFAQQLSKEELQRRSQELRNEIQTINENLAETRSQKKTTYGSWVQIRNKIDTREKLIGNIKDQVYYIEKDISRTYREIDTMKKEMDTLRAQYAKSVIYAYKNRSNYDFLNFIFSAGNFNDALRRLQYLKTYRQYREQQAGEIKKTKQLLENKIASLTGKRVEKSTALAEQSKQMTELEKEKQEKDKVLADLNAKEGQLAKTMKSREAQRSQIDKKIKQVIAEELAAARAAAKKEADRIARQKADEEEARRKANLAAAADARKAAEEALRKKNNDNANTTNTKPTEKQPVAAITPPVEVEKPRPTRAISPLENTPEGIITSEQFEKNQHNLPWPVEQGTITLHFGNNSIPAKPRPINVQSDGITIETPVGSPVKAIFDGIVTSVSEIGNTSLVIIKHGKYYSAYSSLGSASVSKGTKVSRGQVVGKAGENDEGAGVVDLTIANERGNLNPEAWIRRR
jgi:septal ring factor EnvC (AmiA/AmiB activator)